VKLVAALAWYAEPIAFLDRCIRSLEGLVDHIIAVDGPWALFPYDSDAITSAEEWVAIREAADAIGVRHSVHAPAHPWDSQVHKRDMMMRWASEHGDWILVIDGDEYVAHAEPEKVRAELSAVDETCVIGEVQIKNLHRGGQIPGYHPDGGLARRLYRSGTTVDIVHTGYFHNGQPLYRGEPTVDLREHLILEHDICNRGWLRNDQSIAYREARERSGVEVWT
jgi:hypothetical protein